MASGSVDFHKQLTHNSFRQHGLSLVGLTPLLFREALRRLDRYRGEVRVWGMEAYVGRDDKQFGTLRQWEVEFLGQYKDGWLDTVVKKDNCWSHPMRFQILDQ